MMYNPFSILPSRTENMNKTSFPTRLEWRTIRWLTALLGLGLLNAGQFQIASDTIADKPATKLGIWLNEEIHLSIPTIDNVLRGLPLLLVGAILLIFSLRGL
jgi:hypothetical protein